ncbi:peptidoglycan glycosyltransferase [Lachnospiraceae bacterium NE2001]|nr:peptidoglycan glycosyltransferase [Lachnospiraceae bacterium NE2001]
MKAFLEKEREKVKKNQLKNKPLVLMTYMFVLIFIGMFGYLIYFMVKDDTEQVVANTSNKRQDSFEKFVIRGDIITSDGVVLATTNVDEEGNETRYYPYGSLFAHTVGYDSYGRSGIELSENFDLMRSHVNIVSKVGNDLGSDKNPGDTVVTSLDYNLQQTAADALGGAKGAVIVLEASTGRILVMYSNPTFDPNDIDNVWADVHSEEGSTSTVLLNRATQGLYAPGSTFKIITLMEYMKEHPDYENYRHTCYGSDIFNSVSIRCSNSTAHGELDLSGTLAHSCNTSVANIGCNELDIDSLRSTAEKLLYNSELPYDGEYSRSQFKLSGESNISEIPQTVIGQGDTLITPLHNALIMQAIANGGVLMKPYIVDGIENADGVPLSKNKSKSCGSIIEPEVTREIIPMLQQVVTDGTASQYLGGKPYTVAGKTGTAEYDNNGNCNSWFVGFSDVDDPDIVISVIVEDYTTNQTSGTYVASKVFDAYYNNTNQ